MTNWLAVQRVRDAGVDCWQVLGAKEEFGKGVAAPA